VIRFALLVASAGCSATAALADPAAEVGRTWEGALIYAPTAAEPTQMAQATALRWLSEHPDTAVVVYAHGCDGISKITSDTGRFLAGQGYFFVAPDSFARDTKPLSCDAVTLRSGLHRDVLAWRQNEIDNAIGLLRAATDAPIALMGHSEGAITAATYSGKPVDARIIEGWTCHAGWSEYAGLNAPPSEPVLSLVGSDDPWFTASWARGDCGEFMDENDRSVVFRKPSYLHKKHWLSVDQEVRQIVSAFLRGNL
jgi:dienelactone hydrolase